MSKEINNFKADALFAFTDTFTPDDPTRLIIQTSNGTLNGFLLENGDLPEVYDETDKFVGDPADQKTPYAAALALFTKYRENSIKNTEGNNDYLKGVWLKDVRIFLSGQSTPIETPYYFLFLDQVVGITYGDLKTNSQDIV